VTARAPIFSAFCFQVWFTTDANDPEKENEEFDGAFSEVTGLEMSVDVKPYNEGGNFSGPRQLVSMPTTQTLVLKRGLSASQYTWAWFNQISAATYPLPRKGVIIQLLDTNSGFQGDTRIVSAWKAVRAVPVKMRVSDLNAKTGELAIEELHLAHEGLTYDFSVKVSQDA
jgi:phage tail-like protein